MAHLIYQYPIEEVHGKLKGKFGASRRLAKNNKGERPNFSICYGTRSTKPSSAELARRATFAANAAKVLARMQSITKSAADMAAAREAGMTYKAYVWSLATSGALDEE